MKANKRANFLQKANNEGDPFNSPFRKHLAMNTMLITYQPAARSNPRLFHLISTMGEYWSPVANVWILKTSLSTTALLARLRIAVSASDNLFVMELGKRYATNLPEGNKEWLYKYLR